MPNNKARSICPSFVEVMDRGYNAGFCLVGNLYLYLYYTLILGTPDEVDAEVKAHIDTIGVEDG